MFTEANDLAKLKDALLAAESGKRTRVPSMEPAGDAASDELAERIAAIQTNLGELAQIDAESSRDLKLITEGIRDTVLYLVEPNQTVTLKDGLEILETYVYDLVAAYKDVSEGCQ